MIRRGFWVALGLGAGVTFGVLTTRWFHRKTQPLKPANLVRQGGAILTNVAGILLDAAREFRAGAEQRAAASRDAGAAVTRLAQRRIG
ncbi:MAG TPA: hypothetical protein VF660_04840 [Actinomycetota bacterium]|jgi:hypothetical protein